MDENKGLKPKQGVAKMKEVSGNTNQVGGAQEVLKGGVYRHPGNGAEIIALDDPITGDAQARGYVRAGFEWVRDVKEGDVKLVGAPSEVHAEQPERLNEQATKELADLRARLAALEGAQDKKASDEAAPQTATELSQKHAQDAAEQKTEQRGADNSDDVAVNGGVNAPVTPEVATDEQSKTPDEPKTAKDKASKEEGNK